MSKNTRPLRRTAALLCAALAGLTLAGRAAAQVAGPLATSPITPTPWESPLYHGGGGGGTTAPTAANAPFLTPQLDPLQNQLQGTPSGLVPITGGANAAVSYLTQIPSFLLGNYDPTRPPGALVGGTLPYYPNHFADGGVYQWAAPFSFTSQSATTVTVDDNASAPTATASGFVNNGGFVSINDNVANPAAGTATDGEYLRLPINTNGSVSWTLYQPTGGTYSLYFHIPNDLPASDGTVELRSTQVLYLIAVRDVNGNVISTTTATTSQTEANDTQFLAGPFQVPTGGTVGVTLARTANLNAGTIADYLVADSMTLQQAVGDVQSAPTVITSDLYPADFASATHPLQYWGIFVPPTASANNGAQAVGTEAAVNANPDTTLAALGAAAINGGNILLKSGDINKSFLQDGVTVDPLHLRQIRQLVYFGRSDPSASISNSVDDSQAAFAGGGTTVSGTVAVTASNGEYKTNPTTQGTALTAPVATWTVPVPSGSTSNFFVYAHIPANANGELRLSRVYYTVTVNGVTSAPVSISQVTQGTDALVALPTGALSPAVGSSIIVRMYNVNGLTTSSPTGSVVVADSVTVSTGTGQGAIYCVDGFTGSVVWRYETPGSANGSSAPVFASPAIAKINVMITPPVYGAGGTITTPAVYANRLVAIIGDNNGLVYCLDAIGNGDGTSNVNVLAKTLDTAGNPVLDASGFPIVGPPVTIPQPAYGGAYGAIATPLTAGTAATTAAATAHVGTTGQYWVYRPDASQPKYVTGTNIGAVKPSDPTTDLPVPAAFNTASPNIFVDPTVPTFQPAIAGKPVVSNSKVFIGNSNGVLYALDGGGAAIDGTSAATYKATGDTFNVSQDIQGSIYPEVSIPSAQPLWWFSLRGVDPNSGDNASSADIESAPAIYVKAVTTTVAGVTSTAYVPTVYIGSAHEMESTSNVGRLYALNGLYGPSGNSGRTSPLTQPLATAANYTGPGSFNYNVGQIPQVNKADTSDWTFPDENNTTTGVLAGFAHTSSTGLARPALGNMTGSPVVFTNILETVNNPTRIYVAACSGQEYPATARPDDTETGRIWAVNLDGTVGTTTNSTAGVWAYPLANDPNNAASDTTAEPYAPMGSFLRATPAIGFVQFPAAINNSDGSGYAQADVVYPGGIVGKGIPMLYVGTQGVNDTALYAINIDGAMTTPISTTETASGTVSSDQRTIFRVVSPDGSIFQASPVLVANASSAGGNGGSVYAVAGNTLYDYGATPISNPFGPTSVSPALGPLIRENAAKVGFGPISSPAVAGADTTDQSATFLADHGGTPGISNNSNYTTNTTDWIYVGDSSTGLCRGITPNDSSYGGIAVGLGQIVPPAVNGSSAVLLDALIQTFLVNVQTSTASTDSKLFGLNAPLPVYEWGESAYARFSNVVPPNPTANPALFVYDSRTYPDLTQARSAGNPVPFYTSDGTTAQTVTFNLSDVDVTSTAVQSLDSGSVLPVLLNTPPPDGFVKDSATTPPGFFTAAVQNLRTTAGDRYLGTYTYTIADGTARNNTPGARRRFQNVRQLVTEWDYTGDGTAASLADIGNYTKAGTVVIGGDATNNNVVTVKQADGSYGFAKVDAIDQPTFGILNPLGVRGGGVNLLNPGSAAVPVGDEVGPFRGVLSPPTLSTTNGVTTTTAGDAFALQALSNGNNILTVAPPSSSGVGSPTLLPESTTDPNGVNTATNVNVVVTTTGLIAHNTSGDNSEPEAISTAPTGFYTNSITVDGLQATTFGGDALNLFDRGALYDLGQSLRAKMTVPTNTLFAPAAGRDGLYWNSNVTNDPGNDAVVNFLPWETPPTPYAIGGSANGSSDYPDIAPGNIVQNAVIVPNLPGIAGAGGDLTSNNVILKPAFASTSTPTANEPPSRRRIIYANPVQIQVSIPNHQPPNQQLYHQPHGDSYLVPSTTPAIGAQVYSLNGQIAPVTVTSSTGPTTDNLAGMTKTKDDLFPMGYVTSKRIYVPNASGNYGRQRPYRDVRVYTGVPIDMRTSVVNPTIDIGKAPAAFGVQTEQYMPTASPLGLFMPYNPAFQNYFKPIEIHNDGNVNLLNVHLDQRYTSTVSGGVNSLLLNSDSVDPLSYLSGYDLPPAGGTYGVTGPRGTALPSSNIQEQPFLIRSSIDTDLAQAYGRNPFIVINYSAIYPGATFHKPTAGGNQPSVLTVPDDPETYVQDASLDSAPNGVPTIPTGGTALKAPPYVSLAFPFGTPVGTYSTPVPSDPTSLRLFEGIDVGPTLTAAYNLNPGSGSIPNYLYPPKYNGAVGGIGTPSSPNLNDVYTTGEPLSTTGTQLIGTVLEQRLTDGATFGAVPMIDAPQVPPTNGNAATTSTPDFAPAAFRDPNTGNLSVYWTSGRNGGYGIVGANLPFTPSGNTPGQGYFLPTNPAGQWWQPFTPAVVTGAVNSGLSITPGSPLEAFDVAVITAPYNNTLYSYTVTPGSGALSNPLPITTDSSQVKYGVKGLNTGNSFTNNLWAFWTASTGGRTALNYNSLGANGQWIQTPPTAALLPIPAGLTSVADASPILIQAPVTTGTTTALAPTIEVTYSGTAPGGNVDLYASRYQPDAKTPTQLDLVPFPAVTENLRAAGQWYQSRDAAWSRTGALNIYLNGKPILYNAANVPLFTKAIYDKASGLLVLTGVQVPQTGTGQPTPTTNTVYVDAATGRIRFSPALLTASTQNFNQIRATFSPLARRLTIDSRADTAPVTFLDTTLKTNDAANVANSTQTANVEADRRWTIWRKAGVSGVPSSASLYYKTQRLTYFLPSAVDVTKQITVSLNGGPATTNYDLDYARGRIYFPIATGAEGETVAVTYTAPGATTVTTIATDPLGLNTVQWQDEPLANNSDIPPADSAAGLDAVYDNGVPLDTAVNENNVSAFLDPFAGLPTANPTNPHKVWLFWNSTRNGTADIYSETIDPRFAPGTP